MHDIDFYKKRFNWTIFKGQAVANILWAKLINWSYDVTEIVKGKLRHIAYYATLHNNKYNTSNLI